MLELRFVFQLILKLQVTQLNTCLKLNGSPPPGSNSAWRCTCWTPSFWSSSDIQNLSLDVLVVSVIPNPQLPGKSVRWVSLCRFSRSKSKQPYQRQELQLYRRGSIEKRSELKWEFCSLKATFLLHWVNRNIEEGGWKRDQS